jgi:hypothetical protein
MHKSATKCNETIGKWCKNKHGASKIIDTFETYQGHLHHLTHPRLAKELLPLSHRNIPHTGRHHGEHPFLWKTRLLKKSTSQTVRDSERWYLRLQGLSNWWLSLLIWHCRGFPCPSSRTTSPTSSSTSGHLNDIGERGLPSLHAPEITREADFLWNR